MKVKPALIIFCLTLLAAPDSNAEQKTEALAKKYASEYIQAREEYYYKIMVQNFEKVRVMSKPEVFLPWKREYAFPSGSIIKRYGMKIRKAIEIDYLKLKYNKTTNDYFIEAKIISKEYAGEEKIKEYNQKIDMWAYFDKKFQLDDEELKINPDKFVVSFYSSEIQ